MRALDLKNYDEQNIFARIIRGELSCKKIHEDEHVVAFFDLHPKASIHILIIPKGSYCSIHDFSQNAPAKAQKALWKAVSALANHHHLDETGYRTITNHGEDSGQEIPHFHVHLLGGQPLGPMVSLPQ